MVLGRYLVFGYLALKEGSRCLIVKELGPKIHSRHGR